MRYLTYWEPHEDGDQQIRVSQAQAVERQRAYAFRSHGYTYESDEEALLDFMAVHWASWEDEPPIGIYTPFIPLQVTNIFKKE